MPVEHYGGIAQYLAAVAAVASAAHAGRLLVHRPPRLRARRPRWPHRLLSLLGFVVTMSSSPASAHARVFAPPLGRQLQPESRRSETSGPNHPPRPLVPAGPSATAATIHPAIHGTQPAAGRVIALFPRAGARRDGARREAILHHPSGRRARRIGTGLFLYSSPRVSARRHRSRRDARVRPKDLHVVGPGESLWSIAATRLGTTDPARIARYWPRIYRANRARIGHDPHLILPGQRLVLPPESA